MKSGKKSILKDLTPMFFKEFRMSLFCVLMNSNLKEIDNAEHEYIHLAPPLTMPSPFFYDLWSSSLLQQC